MEGQIGQTSRRLSYWLAFESHTDGLVEPLPAMDRDILIQRFANLVMDEGVAAVRLRPHQTGARCTEHQVFGRFEAQIRCGCQQRD